MRREEAHALGDLAGEAAGGIAAQVREVHEGIAERVFGSLGPAAESVQAVHDRVADGAYAGARLLTRAIVRGGARIYGLTRSPDAPSLEESLQGRLLVGAVNGAWGDVLESQRNQLAWPMTVRYRGRDLVLSTLPSPRPRLAVFVHGLCETDDAWRLHSDQHVPYGDRLESELDYTSVYVRYNSGLHISHNGRRLAELLSELTAAWPVEVSEIALIGHSMGGLVARGACHYAGEGSWRLKVRHVFMLGAPHRGAPLELAANAASHAISTLPETRGFAKPLKARSVGVKDLGYGYVLDEDWSGHDPDAFWTNTGTEVPYLETANHYFVSATLTQDPEAPVGRLLGDLLVLRPSAWSHGRGERLRFPVDHYTHLGGASHFDLLNHPAIYEQIKRWLTAGRQLPAPAVV
jgi:pimeloyl-ACP methyl ester carboxylesterase